MNLNLIGTRFANRVERFFKLSGWQSFNEMNRVVTLPGLNLSGCLLVATPRWEDPLFRKSVCLVVNHGSQGAVGVMLNRSLNADVKALIEQLGGTVKPALAHELFLGGLQSGPVVAMHQQRELAEYVSAEGVYFAAQVDSLKRLVAESNPCRIYVGQAVWEAGQLEAQFAQGCWLPVQINSRVAFEAADSMWFVALREAGNRFVEGMLNSQAPSCIEWN